MKISKKLNGVPPNISFLSNQEQFSFPPKSINLTYDPKTFETRCTTHVPKTYYKNYLMTTTYSGMMQQLQKRQSRLLLDYHGNPESIIEIGCGDGSFLKHCGLLFKKVVGIEPSEDFILEAEKTGFEIIKGYVSSKISLTKDKFDCFVCRQVFEHLENPTDVLLGIKKMLKNGSVGLIEVPNGYRALRKNRFYEFFPDHTIYYSVNSLVGLASKLNFNVISCNESFGGNYLELWVRNDVDSTKYLGNLSTSKNNTLKKISKFICEKDNVVIYGAGAKTMCILPSLKKDIQNKISYVVDDDPHKWNKYIPNTSIKIVDFSVVEKSPPKIVFICALNHITEVKYKIKNLSADTIVFTLDEDNNIIPLTS